MTDDSVDALLVDEARRIIAQVEPLVDATEAGAGETVRVTLTIPKEWAVLAAWSRFKAEGLAGGRISPLPRPVMLHLENGQRGHDWTQAKAHFAEAIEAQFENEWTRLLLRGLPATTGPDEAGDDLPF